MKNFSKVIYRVHDTNISLSDYKKSIKIITSEPLVSKKLYFRHK